jgi:hypothetical protein
MYWGKELLNLSETGPWTLADGIARDLDGIVRDIGGGDIHVP